MEFELKGHTLGIVYKDRFFSEDEYSRLLENDSKIARKIDNLDIMPRLREAKIEFLLHSLKISFYHRKDFDFKKVVAHKEIRYMDICHVEIKKFGNRHFNSFDYKIYFYNTYGDVVLYFNFGNNHEFYDYENSIKGLEHLISQLSLNNVEFDLVDETYFK